VTDIYTPAFFAEHHGTVTLSASVVAPIVMEQLAPRSALDIGCGWGEWLEAFALSGMRRVDMLGVDIAASEDEDFLFPEGVVCDWQDLTEPFYMGRAFDLVICLEVAEHLPASAADTLVDTIVRHAKDAVLFSGAVPGQEGLHHVNCQPHEYWHEKFEARGFAVTDPIRPLIANNHYVSPWYRNNIFVYERVALEDLHASDKDEAVGRLHELSDVRAELGR
jgi:SAM-dependent methyltransferase